MGMKEYHRLQYREVLERIKEQRKFIQVLAGPRQVGKSTLMSQVVKDIDFHFMMVNADAVAPNDSGWIYRIWESARAQMSVNGYKEFLLVIDEVQKINRWSEYVKREWDADTQNHLQLKLVLLGSSRLLLKAGLTESLAGRFELIRMTHWSYREMHDAFGWNIDQYVYFGGYPGAAGFIGNERRWRSYIKDSLVAPAIDKDVIMTSNIYKPALMRQLFELGCSYSAEILSLTKLLGQLQDAGNVTTLSGYLSILDECGLLTGLHKYAQDIARKYNSIPKYQVYNNALLTAYRGKSFVADIIDAQRRGLWIESAVGAHLVSCAQSSDYKVYYWRDGDKEVDFILQGHGQTIAIEVKSGRRGMNSGIPAFKEKFSPRRAFVVGTDGFPLKDFLETNPEDLFD